MIVNQLTGWAYPPIPKYASQSVEFEWVPQVSETRYVACDEYGRRQSLHFDSGVARPIVGICSGPTVRLTTGEDVDASRGDVVCQIVSDTWGGHHDETYDINGFNRRVRTYCRTHGHALYPFFVDIPINENGNQVGVVKGVELAYAGDPNVDFWVQTTLQRRAPASLATQADRMLEAITDPLLDETVQTYRNDLA